MVSVFASSAVDRGFDPRSGQTKDYKIGICFSSTKHTVLRRKSKDRLTQNQGNVSKWGDMNCCLSELALLKSNYACWSSTKQTSSSFH